MNRLLPACRRGLCSGQRLVAIVAVFMVSVPICDIAPAALITGLGGPNNVAPQASVAIPFVNPSQYPKVVDQIVSDKTLYDDSYAALMQSSPAEIILTWAAPVNLTQLSAYVSSNVPAGVDPFLDRETLSVAFAVDTTINGTFSNVGTVADTSFTLAPDDPTKIWSVAAVNGNWTGIRRVQYTFTKAGANNSRVGEVIATVPEPSALGLLGAVVLAGPFVAAMRRRQISLRG